MQNLILVGLGGGFGAILRWSISLLLNSEEYPLGTLTVNLVGSFLLGLLTLALAQELVSETTAIALGVGVLGAFTTMSTYSMETVKMLQNGSSSTGLIYLLITMVFCPAFAYFGWYAGARVFA